MNSTWGARATRLGWLVALWCLVARVQAADTDMPRPPELEPDVQFWIRVYTQVDTNGGFIHDADNLAVVYDTLHFEAGTSAREREKSVDKWYRASLFPHVDGLKRNLVRATAAKDPVALPAGSPETPFRYPSGQDAR